MRYAGRNGHKAGVRAISVNSSIPHHVPGSMTAPEPYSIGAALPSHGLLHIAFRPRLERDAVLWYVEDSFVFHAINWP